MSSYVNKMLEEIDSANAGMWEYIMQSKNNNAEVIQLVMCQIEGVRRLKMKLEHSGLFKYKEPLDNEQIEKALKDTKF